MADRTPTETLVEVVMHYAWQDDKLEEAATRLAELQAEVERLNEAEAESLAVIDVLSRRLAEVVLVMKGEPPPNVRFSYHDLGELCAAMKAEVSRLDTDAMHLDAEREYWMREARGLRERIAGAPRVVVELGAKTIAMIELAAAELENPNG